MQDSLKNILLLIPSLESGGMERVMAQYANYLAKNSSYKVHLVLYGITRNVFYPVSDNIVIHKPAFVFNNNTRLWHTVKTLMYIRRMVMKIKPYSILSFGEIWNNFVLLATRGVKCPIIISDRCQPDKQFGRFHDGLRKLLYPGATGIICQTSFAKEIYSKQFRHNNIVVIGNPIKEVDSLNAHTKKNIILSVGRLIKTKHFDELIQLFAGLNAPDWKLVIVGDDALNQNNKEKLQHLINDLGMQERIILAGKQSDVNAFYSQAKLFAFTSSSEGFPNVIGEAMAAGLPVVAYNCTAGPADLIEDHKTGFLIPLHDTTRFKQKLSVLIQDEVLRTQMGNAARISIKRFSAETILKQVENFTIHACATN